MQTIYLNTKQYGAVETVDEFTRGNDAPDNPIEFRKYVNQMVKEYSTAGISVYKSSRSTRDWKV